MEANRYRHVCRLIDQVSPHRRRPRQQFSDARIIKVFLYAVLKDRPRCFACDPANWEPKLLESVGTLPSPTTLGRRLRSIPCQQLLERLLVLLGEDQPNGLLKCIDSKPLVVGNYSRDRHATRGRAAGSMARGYKLHAICRGKQVVQWMISSMNVSDQTAATHLIPRLEGVGYLSADNGYDSNRLYRLATTQQHQLVAPARRNNRLVYDVRRNSAGRLRSLDLLNPLLHRGAEESFGQSLMRERTGIERAFGHMAMLGLNHLPPWVRRPHRVAAWVAGKLIFYMMRCREIKRLTAIMR